MVKQFMFVVLLVLQGYVGVALSSGSPAFEEWLKTFDPSIEIASKLVICAGRQDGFYADQEPELICSDIYTACVFGTAYEQKCTTGEVFDSTSTVRKCVDPYVAQSTVCQYTVPPPSCNANNVGVYQPTAKCSDLYYVCLSATGQPQFQYCSPGLPTHYFDLITGRCEEATGAKACQVIEENVPLPACNADNVAWFQPTAKCSSIYYICLSSTGIPQFFQCYHHNEYFDPITATCQDKLGASACQDAGGPGTTPITVPVYGCGSDKTTGFAYAITECSTSFYTCDRNTSPSPIPASCNAYGEGKVFNYKAIPTKPSSASCILKSTVPECGATAGCISNPDGFYAEEPDTCSADFRVCIRGNEYRQTCSSGDVFDSSTSLIERGCVNRYEAMSDACAIYPAPACTADSVGIYSPTGRCSDIFYFCTSVGGEPIFQACLSGMFFDPLSQVCVNKAGVQACQ